LPQVVADYTISAYFRSPGGIYVNLYVPSRLNWTVGPVRCSLLQQTTYPTGSLITMTLDLSAPLDFALHLRVPAWAGNQTSVSVNGKRLTTAAAPGTFYALQRTWKTGDVVEFDIDQQVRTEAVDAENPNQVAILRGPQVLFGISSQQPELPSEQLSRLQLAKAANNDWTLEAGSASLLLRPFADIGEETYQTYLAVSSAKGALTERQDRANKQT
jgi:DUF1680 family protein